MDLCIQSTYNMNTVIINSVGSVLLLMNNKYGYEKCEVGYVESFYCTSHK